MRSQPVHSRSGITQSPLFQHVSSPHDQAYKPSPGIPPGSMFPYEACAAPLSYGSLTCLSVASLCRPSGSRRATASSSSTTRRTPSTPSASSMGRGSTAGASLSCGLRYAHAAETSTGLGVYFYTCGCPRESSCAPHMSCVLVPLRWNVQQQRKRPEEMKEIEKRRRSGHRLQPHCQPPHVHVSTA